MWSAYCVQVIALLGKICMVCILNRLVGWVIYTIKSGLCSCQGPNITFFDAIDNFFHNYLTIVALLFSFHQPVQGELAPFPLDKKKSEEHTSELQSPDHLVCR